MILLQSKGITCLEGVLLNWIKCYVLAQNNQLVMTGHDVIVRLFLHVIILLNSIFKQSLY